MNILTDIKKRTLIRVQDEKSRVGLHKVRRAAERRLAVEKAQVCDVAPPGLAAGREVDGFHRVCDHPFEAALKRPGLSFICEVKRASPSEGLIASHFPYVKIARQYEEAGADALSCLTEPYWFQGKDEHLRDIARAVDLPVLRKDFVVDEYQIFAAKALGAHAVLLIVAMLDDAQLHAYQALCDELQLCSLIEVHTRQEVQRALAAEARVIGINNRDLATFKVNIQTSVQLRAEVPPELLCVAESGIRTHTHVHDLERAGVDGVLVGQVLMSAPHKGRVLAALRGGVS